MNTPTRDPEVMNYAEDLRIALARRRDKLVSRQRRRYSSGRQKEIDQLQREYESSLAIALRMGAEEGL